MDKHITDIFSNCVVESSVIKLPNMKLTDNDFKLVKRYLEKAGGKWNTKAKGFKFLFENEDVLAILTNLSEGKSINFNKANQFFYTTDEAWDFAYGHFMLSDNMRILEPSAGQGHMVDQIMKEVEKLGLKNVTVDCIEKNKLNRKILIDKGYNLVGEDFMDFTTDEPYDLIVANPPFTGAQDIAHVYKMWGVVKEGGNIVTYTSDDWLKSIKSHVTAFKKWLKEQVVHWDYKITPPKAFSGNGSNVGTTLLTLHKIA